MHPLRADIMIAARPDLSPLLGYLLELHGYKATFLSASDQTALEGASVSAPLIVDDEAFLEFHRSEAFRRRLHDASSPILFLQSPQGDFDEACPLPHGMKILRQPVSAEELLHHVRFLQEHEPSRDASLFIFGDLELDVLTQRVRRNSYPVCVGPRAFLMLRQLIEAPQIVHSRELLLSVAWPKGRVVELRAVDVHIGKLRRALTSRGEPDLIRTVRSVGYSLDFDD